MPVLEMLKLLQLTLPIEQQQLKPVLEMLKHLPRICVGDAKSYAASASDRAITSIAQQRLIPVLEMQKLLQLMFPIEQQQLIPVLEMLKHLPLMHPIVLHQGA